MRSNLYCIQVKTAISPSAQEQILALAKYFKLPNTENKFLPQTPLSGCAKLFVSLRATAKQSQSFAMIHTLRVNASFHFVPLAMTNAQLILPKYLAKNFGVLERIL